MAVVKPNRGRTVIFEGRSGLRQEVIKRVDAYLTENGLSAREVPAMYSKTATILVGWLATYLLILLGGLPPLVNALLCAVWAFAIAAVGFNIMHDANHESYSSRPRVNKVLGFTAELMGISGFRWRTKHNVWHHTYTNISGLDDDVESYGTMRLSPNEPWKPLYRFQAWYFPLVYALIGLDFFLRDFLMLLPGSSGVRRAYPRMNRVDKVVFWSGKLFFVLLMFGLPLLFFPWWHVLIGFFIVMLVVGFIFGIVFQCAHIMKVVSFPEPVGDPLHIENAWAMHQVEATVNFAPRNRWLSWYIGGLNYQIEHHLLPRVCHVNYPGIAPIVRATCNEYGVRYKSYETWRQALVAHVSTLRTLGRKPRGVSLVSGR